MRLQFSPQEEKPVALPGSVATISSVTKAGTIEIQVAQGRSRQVRKAWTLQQRMTRHKRVAACTLAISLAIGLRWNYANRAPVYPRGEGVYRTREVNTTGQGNAGHFYAAAVEAVPAGLDNNYRDITPAQQKEAVRKSAESLALIREGVKHPFYGMPEQKRSATDKSIDELLHNYLLHNYINQRSLGRLLATDAHLKRVAGNASGAMSVSLDEMQYGVDFGQGRSFVQGMIGNLLQLIGQQEAFESSRKLPASEARNAITRLESILLRAATYSQIMTAERDDLYEKARMRFDNAEEMILFYDAERFAMESKSGDTEPTGVPDRGWYGIGRQMAYNSLVFIYTRQGLVNDYAATMDQQILLGKMSYQKAKALGPVQTSSNPWIAKITRPSPWALRQCTEISTGNQMLLGELAVQAYKEEHGGHSLPL